MKDAIKYCSHALLLVLCLAGVGAQHTMEAQSSGGGGSATPRPATTTATPRAGGTQTPSASSTNTATTPTTPPAPLDIGVRASERPVDESLPDDPAVNAVLAPYSVKVRELNAPIGKLSGGLKKGGMGGGSLGNFVADALRSRAEALLKRPVLLAVVNSSGLRKNQIAEGDISSSDIYELLPFENALVTLDLTGEQLRRFLDLTVERRNAQSGARIVYRNNKELKKNEIVSVKLVGAGGEQEINPAATYTIVTIDYLVKRGGEYSVLQEGKNLRPLSLTMRDAVLEYVRAETAAGRPIKAMLDGRFRYDRSTPTDATEDDQP